MSDAITFKARDLETATVPVQLQVKSEKFLNEFLHSAIATLETSNKVSKKLTKNKSKIFSILDLPSEDVLHFMMQVLKRISLEKFTYNSARSALPGYI
ncbi:uncharacterized protein LOC118195368 isoform X2 [Stegodyphus dumicola]|uniref:uncharacterized protein LOC118195368 isoform X2 n=1 Tax=Stegodyphus dumicola TaxID=202533 RepID=UPI0015B1CE4F|nr:uncharacterized protein LOC118195368 isoform X2 [Stegodyphus dumicola]